MSKCLTAYTKLDQIYPGYINFTREKDGTVSVHLRGDPEVKDGCYVCAYSSQKGEYGRCTPGDQHCNNYCNMAPEKGPMQPSPKDLQVVQCGATVKLSLSSSEFNRLFADLRAAVTG